MKVLLTADVKKVGQRGSVVTVADGYALNVLIPQKKAVPATPDVLQRYEKGVEGARRAAEASVQSAKTILATFEGRTLTMQVAAGPTGTLFKSLHAKDIVTEIQKQWGIALPESALELAHPIKQKGTHVVPVMLSGVQATLTVVI